jgi:hypothetical protein
MEQPKHEIPSWIDPQGSTIPAYKRKAKYLNEQKEQEEKYAIKNKFKAIELDASKTSTEKGADTVEQNHISQEEIFQTILKEAEEIQVRRNKEGKLITKDGSISNLQDELYWKIARTPSFKKWFKGSVVCYSNGEPKVVYRASLAKEFDISDGVKFASNGEVWHENHIGVFFTSKRKRAVRALKTYFKDKTSKRGEEQNNEEEVNKFLEENEAQVKVFPAFIRLKNPFIERGHLSEENSGAAVSIGDFTVRRIEGGEKFLKQLQKNNDGLYIPESDDYGDEYAVIKSEDILILPSAI